MILAEIHDSVLLIYEVQLLHNKAEAVIQF